MRHELERFRRLAGKSHAPDRFRRQTHGDGQPLQVHRKSPPVESGRDNFGDAELFEQRLGANATECGRSRQP
jgi:hypothetical protein